MKKLSALSSKLNIRRIFKYLLVGLITFLSEYLSFLFLLHIVHAHLIAANSISFFISLVSSFLLNKRWVFENRQNTKSIRQLGAYAAIALVNIAISNILIHNLVAFGLPESIAKLCTIGIIAAWNFFLYSKIFADSKVHPLE